MVGGDGHDYFDGVAVTADGGIVAVGYTNSSVGDFRASKESAMAVLFDGRGNVLWARTIEFDVESQFSAVAIGADGSIYAVGMVYMPTEGQQCEHHALAAKLTSAGDVVWHHTYGDACNDYFTDVVASDDGVIAVGYSLSLDDECDALIAGINDDGYLAWSKTSRGDRDEILYSVARGLDGAIVAVGLSDARPSESASDEDNAGLIVGFSPTGDRLWTREIRGSGLDLFIAVSTAPNNTFFIVGKTTSRDGDLPFAPASGDYVPVCGVFTNPDSPVSFHADAWEGADGFNGATVTSDGLAVAVGGEGLLVGVLTLSDDSYVSTKVRSQGLEYGEFFAAASLVGDRVVAAGCGYKETADTVEGVCYATLVIFSVP